MSPLGWQLCSVSCRLVWAMQLFQQQPYGSPAVLLDTTVCREIQKYASKSFGRMGIDVRLGRK